jgi:DNA-binding transcriptional LysR family regulator
VAVVRGGSFTEAARASRTQKAHVSRVVSRLETHALTEVGRDLYERSVGILSALDETSAAIQGTLREPQGVLRLTCEVDLGILLVNRWIASFLKAHPHVRVDAEFSNRMTDLIHEGFDLAIRVGTLASSGLSARKLGHIHCALYASPTYLRGRTLPRHPRELAGHELVMFSPTRDATWQLENGHDRHAVAPAPRFVSNNHIVVRDAIVEGLGVGLLPRFMGDPLVRKRRLVEILAGWAPPPVPVHAVYASSRYLAPKVRAFVDLAIAGAREL